jgi:hypothetical protein
MQRDVVNAWAKPNDWDAHRSIITGLYIDQGKTLREVMGIMQRDHGFVAT